MVSETEATCSTCPFYSSGGHCRQARAISGWESAGRAADFWCSEHPLRQRDRLAAAAMVALLAAGKPPDEAARTAYAAADAMLAARRAR